MQRIVLASAMPAGLLLHATTDLVETLVRQLHQVEQVSGLGGIGQHRVEREAPRTRQVQHREADLVEPALGSSGEQSTRPDRRTPGDHVEQLSGLHVNDRGRPRLRAPAAMAGEQHFVEPAGGDVADAVRVLDQGCAVGDHGVVDRVPISVELGGDLLHGSTVTAEPVRSPTARPDR